MEKSGGEWCHCAVEWATQADRLLGKGDHRYAASDVKKDKMVAQHVYVDKLVLKQKIFPNQSGESTVANKSFGQGIESDV